jgi:NAD(P)H-dependent FMN reductase
MVTPVYDRGVSAGLKCAGDGTRVPEGPWRRKQERPGVNRAFFVSTGAGEAIRTPDPHLGKVMLYP